MNCIFCCSERWASDVGWESELKTAEEKSDVGEEDDDDDDEDEADGPTSTIIPVVLLLLLILLEVFAIGL